jgi:hypothetical protein
MKKSIGIHEFREAFRLHERNNFSYEGLEVLFDSLESIEQDTGNEIELDVIALCCEFSEMTASEVKDYFSEAESWESVEEFLENETWLCGSWMDGKDKRFIFQQF